MKQLPCPISKSALLYGSHIAIETETFSLSYQELEKKVRSFQLYFKTLSIPSDNIGLIASNSINTILLYFAALREGFSVCMLNPKDPLSLQGEKIEELNLFLVRAPVVTPFSSLSLTTFIPADHLSTYLYTSGSSSKPKIAALSFQNHYYSA